ncbi:unnamed protein product [Adineta steineri]|uniref:Peptidase C14 caspase domain-containing protein n=1 Tax=Adineta steineri TaxID=433720 RepID=A0A813W5F6_9BILA|nr:unnamed protein product [Adineta steineri]CAF1408040.1 unnamed protein product [Adineta steineri]
MATSTSTVLRFQRKVALLIGNQNYYRSEDQLRHTINDVDDISIALRNMKFHFSGHGCEINGRNYLLPIDDELVENDKGIENCAINIECILHQWSKQYPSSIIIFILDCCRLPYPYKKKRINNVKRESNDSHPMELPVGTYVVFACSP